MKKQKFSNFIVHVEIFNVRAKTEQKARKNALDRAKKKYNTNMVKVNHSRLDDRIPKMLEQYLSKGWTQSKIDCDDTQFLAQLSHEPDTVSFTGNDIVYYDPIRVCVDNGSIVPIGY